MKSTCLAACCRPLALFALLFLSHAVLAQKKGKGGPENLVQNPSFEEVTPGKSVATKNTIDVAAGWTAPNAGESLLYTTENKNIYDPNGSSWPFQARTGRNVAGMDVYGGSDETPRRQYIQGTLKRPLTVGKKYYFEFWVHYHCEGANNIGIAFLPEKLNVSASGILRLQPVSFQAAVTPYNNDKNMWTLVRDSFTAARPFQSFVIGNFFPNSETKVESRRYSHYFAYVDDIMVTESAAPAVAPEVVTEAEQKKWEYNTTVIKDVQTLTKAPPAPAPVAPVTPQEPAPQELFISKPPALPASLAPLHFSARSAELSAESRQTLDAVAAQLMQDPALKLDVSGYASSEGSTSTNQALSHKRAAMVQAYLLQKGINADRITVIALGEAEAVAPNDTETNRSKNRRVEFKWRQ